MANSPEPARAKWLNGLAVGWGAAEATLFFIVPDVLLSRIALQDCRQALRACVWALGGALAGGVLIWCLGNANPDPVREVFAQIPAVSPQMMDRVRGQLIDLGPWAVFVGPLTGTPYKLYALEAAGTGIGLVSFFLVSLPARMLRFVLVVLLTHWLAAALRRTAGPGMLRILHAVAWLSFYAWYFYVMSGPEGPA
ncbi:MAG: hypothetical protein QNJ23_10460 [Woeseiaceae bacterium]|nr:hypothetical protein [Woeseiaceae bacterium]